MTPVLALPAELEAQLAREASAAYPRECCGLIEGRRDGERIVALALHRARNLSDARDSFEIDPADQFAVLRDCRARGTAVIGCYHSHPDGPAVPSARDRAGAGEVGFVWLIAVAQSDGRGPIAAYVFDGEGFSPVAIARPASLDPTGDTRV